MHNGSITFERLQLQITQLEIDVMPEVTYLQPIIDLVEVSSLYFYVTRYLGIVPIAANHCRYIGNLLIYDSVLFHHCYFNFFGYVIGFWNPTKMLQTFLV